MFEELERLMKLDIKSAEVEEISDLIDVVKTKLHTYGRRELELFFDIAIKILIYKKGLASKKAVEVISSAYSKIREKVVSMLWSYDPHVRNTGLKIIAENKDRDILHVLVKDKDRDIRKFAIDIAYEIVYPELLRYGLDDPDPNVMVTAAEYLSKLGDASAATKIEDKLKATPKDDVYLALFLIQSLINLEYRKTADLIKSKFDVNDPLIKPYYILACGISKDTKYIDDILHNLKNDPSVRKEAIDSLLVLLRDTPVPPDKREKIKEEIESIVPKLTPSELELIRKIQDML